MRPKDAIDAMHDIGDQLRSIAEDFGWAFSAATYTHERTLRFSWSIPTDPEKCMDLEVVAALYAEAAIAESGLSGSGLFEVRVVAYPFDENLCAEDWPAILCPIADWLIVERAWLEECLKTARMVASAL